MLRATEMVCRKCNLVKDKADFPEKKRQCNKCRQSVRSLFRDKFDDVIEDEIKKLSEMNVEDRTKKLEKYIRDELNKIAQFLNIGRK
jgi:RNA polymerase-binding transcription factor DksA